MKKIKKYPKYYATKDGQIYSTKTNKYLKQGEDKFGYMRVYIYQGNYRKKTIKVHRLIAETYLNNKLNKPSVNHIDGNKKNNNVSNLEWVTNSENAIHAFKNKLRVISEKQINHVKKRLSKKIINTETGIVYNSIKEAAKHFNYNYETFRNNFNTKRKNNTKFIFYVP
jgi:hypothetical protein